VATAGCVPKRPPYRPRRSEKSCPQPDDKRATVVDHSCMPTKAALTATAVLAAGLIGVTACGGDSSTPANTNTPASVSATALQTQLVNVVKRISPAIVQLQCGRSLGSGVVLDSRGHVVTNAHVLDGASSCKVTLSGGDTHPASVVGRTVQNDLAVVQVRGATPPPATFADSSKVHVGDFVLAMGNPLGLQSSVTQGIVSSLNRNIQESSTVDLTALIQTSAEINPGNSGGALVDLSGRVIGIPTLAALDPEFGGTEAPGIGFAIPSDTVRRVADTLISAG
jgi:putative serine protease PepD